MFVIVFKAIEPSSCKSYDVKNRIFDCSKDKTNGS
jgi:hypothetical protein